MKGILILDTYPSGNKEVEILNKCIDSFKPLGWDIMIVSHLPIDADTAKKVNYTIYDSDNTFLPPEITPFWFTYTDSFDVKIFNAGHSLPITRNMSTSLNLAKSLGYELFIFTESDVVMDIYDLQKLKGYMYRLAAFDKKMLFFRPEEYRDCNSYVYETLLFGGYINYFLDVFKPPINYEEWQASSMGYTLELSIYEKFSKREHEFFIINDHSSNVFSKSDVNLLRYGLFNCQMLYNETYPDEPALFITNSLIVNERRWVDVIIDNQYHYSSQLHQGAYWFNTYKMDGREIVVNVYNDDKTYLYFTKEFKLDGGDDFKTKGIIKFK